MFLQVRRLLVHECSFCCHLTRCLFILFSPGLIRFLIIPRLGRGGAACRRRYTYTHNCVYTCKCTCMCMDTKNIYWTACVHKRSFNPLPQFSRLGTQVISCLCCSSVVYRVWISPFLFLYDSASVPYPCIHTCTCI